MGTPDEPRRKPGRKPAAGVGRTAVLNVRATPAWRSWLDGLAAHERTTVADTVDRALAVYAKRRKYVPDAPPR